jgi:hypothetical protein
VYTDAWVCCAVRCVAEYWLAQNSTTYESSQSIRKAAAAAAAAVFPAYTLSILSYIYSYNSRL